MRRLTRNYIAACICLLASACITPPVEHQTASGKPEASIAGTPEKIKPQVVSSMLTAGYRIHRDTPYELSFDRPVENIAVAALLGSRYDSQPNARISYSFAPTGGETRVVADLAVVTNPGSAFERRTAMNNGVDSRNVQALLDRLKAEFDPNSSVAIAKRNGIILGVRTVAAAEAGSHGVFSDEKEGLIIASTDPGGNGDKAGLKPKDALLTIDGKQLNSNSDLSSALASIKPGGKATFEISRAGNKMAIAVSFPKPAR